MTELRLINISAEQSLFEKLKEIKGITLGPIGLQFDWKKTELYAVLEKMDKWAGNNGGKIILAFDEAQYFAESETKLQIKALLAHLYDYRQNIKIVLTGSEVVLLYEFIGINDPFSEFYGRYANEISLSPLTEEKAKKFLEEGFSYGGVKVSEEVIENAVENLGGTIGWLTKFGAEATEMALKARKAIKDPKEILEILEKIREEAKMQIMKEVERLVKMEGGKQEDYKKVLHLLTKPGYETFEDIRPIFMDKIREKMYPEGRDTVVLPASVDPLELENKSPLKEAEADIDKLVSSILKNLERFCFLKSEPKGVKKKRFYSFIDPVVKEAAENLK